MGKQRGSAALGRRPKLDVGGLTSGWRREPVAEPAARAAAAVDDGAAAAALGRANPLLGLMSAYDDDDEDDDAAGGRDAPSTCAPAAAAAAQPSPAVWTRVADGASGDVYYWNERTGEVTWSLPSGCAPAAAAPAAAPACEDDTPATDEDAAEPADADDDLAAVLALARSKRADLARRAAAATDGVAAAPSDERGVCALAARAPASAPAVDTAPVAERAGSPDASAREARTAAAPGDDDDDDADADGVRAACADELEEGELAPTALSEAAPPPADTAAASARAAAASAAHGGLDALARALAAKLAVLARTPPCDERAGWALAALQARAEDWRAGALPEPYFAARLGEACAALELLEARGLGGGWARAWDAQQRRYYFARPQTGEAAWELPAAAAAELAAAAALAGGAAPPPPSAPVAPPACACACAAAATAAASAATAAAAAAPSAEPAGAHAAKPPHAAGARGAPKAPRAAEAEPTAGPKRPALSGRRQLEGLLSKWEAVRAEQAAAEEEARARAEPPTRAELDAQRQLELQEWHAQMSADPAVRASNPNFMPLGHGKLAPDAWRERIARARARAATSAAAAE